MKRNLHISMFLVLLLLSTFLIVGQAFGYYLEPPPGSSLMETEPSGIIKIETWLYNYSDPLYRTWSTSINKDIQGDEYFFSFYLGAHETYTVYAEIVLNPGGNETILAQTQFTVTSDTYSLFTDTVTGIDPDIPSGGILAVRLKSNTSLNAKVALLFKDGYMPFVEVPNEYLLYGDDTPSASFSANPTSGNAPLSVNFTDESTETITSWNWNFGDGASSTIQNPSHTYNDLGSYTVTLTVTGPAGSDTETKSDYIKVSPTNAMPWIPLLLLDD